MTQEKVTIDSSNWTAIQSESVCKTVVVLNTVSGAGDVYLRTDSAQAASQSDLPAGTWESFTKTSDPSMAGPNSRWNVGDNVVYAKAVTGSFDVIRREIE